MCHRLFCLIFSAALVLTLLSATSAVEPTEADFTFVTSYTPRSFEPAWANGDVQQQIIRALHEGLLQYTPKNDKPSVLQLKPAMAESYTCSADGKTYSFRIRSAARWSDGSPVTADDFVWSWRRVLHPEFHCIYASRLWDVKGAQDYHEARVEMGNLVEVELTGRRKEDQLFPRGPMLRGKLTEIIKPEQPKLPVGTTAAEAYLLEQRWRDRWVYAAKMRKEKDAMASVVQYFSRDPQGRKIRGTAVQRCHWVLPDFKSTVGIRSSNDSTLVVTLTQPTASFPYLTADPVLSPVQRKCIERHGKKVWTKPENHIGNGAFLLKEYVAGRRIRLTKNPHYYAAAAVHLTTIDVLSTSSDKDAVDLYERGKVDWVARISPKSGKALDKRADFYNQPSLTTVFFRLNVTRKSLDDPLVRRALSMAIDRRAICDHLNTTPAHSLVPPIGDGYTPTKCEVPDVAKAQRLLAQAGYPGGKGLPEWTLTYSNVVDQRQIAQMLQAQWARRLGIRIRLEENRSYTFFKTRRQHDYDLLSSFRIGSFLDPAAFLEAFITDGSDNFTGWSNREYDALIRRARAERNRKSRMALYEKAEAILMRELPILPIYFYSSAQLIRSYVSGLHPNVANIHPLHLIRVDREKKKRVLGTGD